MNSKITLLPQISPLLYWIYSRDYRQENDKKTAIVLTEVLETSLIEGLERG